MKVRECITRGSASISSGNEEIPPLEEAIVKSANPQESADFSNVWIVLDSIPEYNAILYRVREDCKAKTPAIANFIDENKGKRLLEILEMELP